MAGIYRIWILGCILGVKEDIVIGIVLFGIPLNTFMILKIIVILILSGTCDGAICIDGEGCLYNSTCVGTFLSKMLVIDVLYLS